jgi:hypothetical protein
VPDQSPPRRSDIVPAESTRPGAPSDRRAFLANASALTLAIPGLGAALAGCSPAGTERPIDSVQTRAAGSPDSTAAALAQHNSDSRLDSSVLKGARHGATSATPQATRGAAQVAFRRYDPALPPLAPGGRLQLNWHARPPPIPPVSRQPDAHASSWSRAPHVDSLTRLACRWRSYEPGAVNRCAGRHLHDAYLLGRSCRSGP